MYIFLMHPNAFRIQEVRDFYYTFNQKYTTENIYIYIHQKGENPSYAKK